MLRCAVEAPVNEASLRLSYRATLNPRCARCTAARQPTGPAPTTAMLEASIVDAELLPGPYFFGACHLIASTRKKGAFHARLQINQQGLGRRFGVATRHPRFFGRDRGVRTPLGMHTRVRRGIPGIGRVCHRRRRLACRLLRGRLVGTGSARRRRRGRYVRCRRGGRSIGRGRCNRRRRRRWGRGRRRCIGSMGRCRWRVRRMGHRCRRRVCAG